MLEAHGLTVDFPGTRALESVDIDLRAGEVHALMGENGAGKSTLIKVLSGLVRPTAGTMRIGGSQVRIASVADAQRAGISTVFQEVDLQPLMSVAENICLGREERRCGWVLEGALRRRAQHALARVGLDLDVRKSAGAYSIAVQQMMAIARALDIKARILILDEPTSSLDQKESAALLDVMRRLTGQGMAIVFITHFLDQVYAGADRITVLRNGKKVGTWAAKELGKRELVEAMTGRTIGQAEHSLPPATSRENQPATNGRCALQAEGLISAAGGKAGVGPVDLDVRAGEAVGLAGLLGSGRSETLRSLFGADGIMRGRVRVLDQEMGRLTVRSAMRAGVGMCPEDRKREGLLLELSVRENIVLALQAKRGVLRSMTRKEQQTLADHYIRSLKIRTPGCETPVGALSGGNQQKVMLARWMATQPRILLLDEPTRGIDVGARSEIESLIARLRAEGMAIVLASSELDEIVRLCDRATVLRDRKQRGWLEGAALTQRNIIELIAGSPSR